MKSLGELLKISDEKERNTFLRRAFFSDEPVDIDGYEQQALIILLNLTRSSKERADLLDKSAAIELLQNEPWYEDVLATAPWVSTHYLKDPNSRARSNSGLRWFPDNYGLDGQKHLGWSHNAGKVSKSHFLTTEFLWNGRVTSLFEQFSFNEDSDLITILIGFGFSEEKICSLKNACHGGMENCLPNFVSSESVLVLFPDGQGQYLAVTPVTSAGVQRWVHNLIKNPDISCRSVVYPKPFQVSSFLGTCGGKLLCFYYPPRLGRHDYTLNYLIKQWEFKRSLINEKAVFDKSNLALLLEIAANSPVVESEHQHKARLDQQFDRVLQIIEELFSHLSLLRAQSALLTQKMMTALEHSEELDFVQGASDDDEKVKKHFLSQINDLLGRTHYSAQLSYHPILLPIFEKALHQFFQQRSTSMNSEKDSGAFLHFKRLLVYDANARSNPYVLGLPSLTAWAGLVHAFLCNLGYENDRLDFRFAIILRKFSMNQGHPLPVQEIQFGKVTNGPVTDSRSCDFEFDLIVQLPSPNKQSLDLSQMNLFGCLPMRFAGGVLTNPVEGSYGQGSLYRQCDIYEHADDLLVALSQLPSFARIVSADSAVTDKKDFVEHLLLKAVFPIGSGFRFLGKPERRYGVDDFLHAYAEPVLSLVKLRPVHCINPLNDSLWGLVSSNSGIEVSASGDMKW